MADQIGPQPLVTLVPNLGTGANAGDALLDILGGYLQATLNKRASARWAALAPDSLVVDPTAAVVRQVFTHNPELPGHEFNDKALPALYLWRTTFEPPTWWGQGWRVRKSGVEIAWVFPPVAQASQSKRSAFVNVVQAVIDEVIEGRGQDPAYIYPSDPDPNAATDGSDIWKFLSVVMLYLGRVASLPLVIRGPVGTAGVAPKTYFRIQATFDVLERLDFDPAASWDAENGLDVDASISPDDALGALEVEHPLFYRSPSVVSIAPATGTTMGNVPVTITSDEDTFRAGATVEIGDLPATSVVVVDTKTITAVTPAHGAGAVDVTVTNPNGSSGTLADGFTYA